MIVCDENVFSVREKFPTQYPQKFFFCKFSRDTAVKSGLTNGKCFHLYTNILQVLFYLFGATALRGPAPPHSRGF